MSETNTLCPCWPPGAPQITINMKHMIVTTLTYTPGAVAALCEHSITSTLAPTTPPCNSPAPTQCPRPARTKSGGVRLTLAPGGPPRPWPLCLLTPRVGDCAGAVTPYAKGVLSPKSLLRALSVSPPHGPQSPHRCSRTARGLASSLQIPSSLLSVSSQESQRGESR